MGLTMNGIFDDLNELAEEALAPIVIDPANRGRSWDRCYNFFQNYRTLNATQQKTNRELACLHLGFYLASWGMFRGSGFLINKDYTIYEGVIDLLLRQEYEGLWDTHLFQELLTGEEQVSEDDNNVGLIFELADQIKTYFSELTIIRNHHADEEGVQATDTIVTKILLGTLACTPAYDEYFKVGLDACGLHPHSSFSVPSMVRILNACRENGLWPALQQHPIECYGVIYPMMRVVDLYFWTKGFNLRNADQ